MKIKVSLLASTLHESNAFTKENQDYLNLIERELKEKIEITSLDDYDCDIKLIFIASGGSEGLFLKNISLLKEPYYLLTKGTNNSLAASLEILTYLNKNDLNGEILHGEAKYIASRISELGKVKREETKEYIKMGVIGRPSDWLIASTPNYEKVKEIFNIELIDISLDEVIEVYNNTKVVTLDALNFNRDEVYNATRFSKALEEIVNKYNLAGLTIRCFNLLSKIKTTGCLALAKINSLGIIASCEGDIMAMISMYLVKKFYGVSSFQANPSVIDVNKQEIIFAHCTVPTNMCTTYKFETHFESKIGVAIRGKLRKTKVGIFRLDSSLSRFYFDTGVIIDNLEEENLCRTQIKVKMDHDIKELLSKPCGNHHIIFYLD